MGREIESQIEIKRVHDHGDVDSLERFIRKLETIPVLSHEQHITAAKAFSTLELASSLHHDIKEEMPDAKRIFTPPGKNQKNPILAKGVAEAFLEDLGLKGNIELILDDEENLKTKTALSDEEKLERKAVIGYEWKNEVEEQQRDTLAFHLRRRTEQAKNAQQTLIEHNLRWGKTVAQRSANRQLPLDDRIQASFLGVMKAAEKYDWRTGYTFSNYATWWINREIKDATNKEARTIRISKNAEQALTKVKKATEIFVKEHGITPSKETLTEITTKENPELTPTMVSHAIEIASTKALTTLSLDNTDDEVQADRNASLVDKKANTEQAALDSLDGQQIATAFAQLSERERTIIFMRYEHEMTYAQIGEELGVSGPRIRQIDMKTREKLRQSPLLEEYMTEM